MLSKSEKILMCLNNKQKSLCQMVTTELYHKETKVKQTARKWQNSVWVWCLRSVWFLAYPTTRNLIS